MVRTLKLKLMETCISLLFIMFMITFRRKRASRKINRNPGLVCGQSSERRICNLGHWCEKSVSRRL